MSTDLAQIAVLARDYLATGLFWVLGILLVALACLLLGHQARRLVRFLKTLPPFARVVVVTGLVIFTIHGGTKVSNPGHDDDIDLAGIFVEAVHEEVSSGVTNTYTEIDVRFTGSNVDESTAVSVRLSSTNEWTELVKIDPVLLNSDSVTNSLLFRVEGDVTRHPQWWVGDDKPAIVVETQGIVITDFTATSKSVGVRFTCDDEKATIFHLQTRRLGSLTWQTVASVERGDEMMMYYEGFTIGESREWRVMTEYTEGDE